MAPANKRIRLDEAAVEDPVIAELQQQIEALKDEETTFFASSECALHSFESIPEKGFPARHVKERIIQNHELDNRPRLNTSSYVNVVAEPEELSVARIGLEVNLADGAVYPASIKLHDLVVNMIANLWNCPKPQGAAAGESVNFSGAGTVGSTEACLLAGLAHKFRWRAWYAKKHGLSKTQVVGVVPNIIISSCFQAAWEKLFRYFDVEPRFIQPTFADSMKLDPSKIEALVDEKTMAVVGILGNHYNGAYDPIWEMDKVISRINTEKGLQIGIHVDAASGGFVAPFQEGMPPFDFRLDNVLTMSASGHKFGEATCGTGWVIFRHREDLAEHVAVRVTYLGGVSDSMTLNFSRPATGPYVQYYKLLRLGREGYTKKVDRQMEVARKLRAQIAKIQWEGQPLFDICDGGDTHSLPVVGARLNPKLKLKFDDFSLQHGFSEFHWYVSAYHLSFEDYSNDEKLTPLCSDEETSASMFRVVVKSNLTHYLANDLFLKLEEVVAHLKEYQDEYYSIRHSHHKKHHKNHHNHHKVC